MGSIAVNVRRVEEQPKREPFGISGDLETDLRRASILANWLDARFSVLGIRFGLDAIVGLVPVVGDTLSAIAALYPLLVAKRHKLGHTLQARMALNVLVDWGIGLVPAAGDILDVAYKSNLKNLKLLEKAASRKRRRDA
jgi:hypothetical protein